MDGQRRLAAARVLVVGAGGLGSPALLYLAAAGVGTIGIVDSDTVDLSNLQRQVIHRHASLGEPKTASAARTIGELDGDLTVAQHEVRLGRHNALDIFRGYDLVVDGSDNFETRYLAGDAAAILKLPYVWGSVLQFDGQVTVFWEGAPAGRSVDYRDLHPTPPAPGEVLSCDEAGVLGAVCGVIGSMMATEAVKLLTGVGEPLLGRLQVFDALAGEWSEIPVARRAGRMPVTALIDYALFCGVPGSGTTSSEAEGMKTDERPVGGAAAGSPAVLPVAGLPHALASGRVLIDVREQWEHDLVHLDGDHLVPLRELLEEPALTGPGPVVVYCKSGARSARAAERLRAAGVDAVSLDGGITAWLREHGRAGETY